MNKLVQYVDPKLEKNLKKSKSKIDKIPNWAFCVKDTFIYDKIHHFDNKKRESRAFYKLYEMCRKYKIIKNEDQDICCLCEAPGGFIGALRLLSPESFIFGTSLENSIKFNDSICNDSQVKTIYTDITKEKNIVDIIKYSSMIDGYDLVTADGSIDAISDYSKQETMNLKLIMCETFLAFHILRKKGNFVLKVFDMHTIETIKVVFLLHAYFDNVQMVKPLTSRPCNSEKYILCFGFRGYKPGTIEGFSMVFDKPDFDMEVGNDFIKQIKQVNTDFAKEQYKHIEDTIAFIKLGTHNKQYTQRVREQNKFSKDLFNKLRINEPV